MCLKYGNSWETIDFFKKKVEFANDCELYQAYIAFTDQQSEHYRNKGMPCGRQDYVTWLVNRGICPQSVITDLSEYWLETINIFDGEMGITLPCDIRDLPYVFFQALSIVRAEKAKNQKDK